MNGGQMIEWMGDGCTGELKEAKKEEKKGLLKDESMNGCIVKQMDRSVSK